MQSRYCIMLVLLYCALSVGAEAPREQPTLADDLKALQGEWKGVGETTFPTPIVIKGTKLAYTLKIKGGDLKNPGTEFELKEMDKKRYIEIVELRPKDAIRPPNLTGLTPRFEYRLEGDTLNLLFSGENLKGDHQFKRTKKGP